MNASQAVAPGSKARASWLPLLQVAAQEVFELMLACPLEIPAHSPEEVGLEITSMVGLAGQLCGIVSLRCTTAAATQMASRMLGLEVNEVGPETWDAVGEICNMIAGNFKNKISGLGDGCMLSVPTVITGADYSLHPLVDIEGVRTVMMFAGEPVALTLEIHG